MSLGRAAGGRLLGGRAVTGVERRQVFAVAVEPTTCPPDAFRSGVDVVLLGPGETWQGQWGITPLD